MRENPIGQEKFSPIYHFIGGNTSGSKPTVFQRTAYPYWCIEYILKGAGYLKIEETTYTINTNDIYILPKGRNHEYGPDSNNPWEKIYLVIDGPLIEELTKIYGIHNSYHFENQEAMKPIFEKALLTLKENEQKKRASIALLIHEIIIHLAMNIKKQQDHSKGLPAKIKHFLDGNLEKPLTLETLEKKMHISKAHLVRVFKQQYEITPYEYFLSRKFALACFYLTETNYSLKQIAEKLCFKDVFYFSRFFNQRAKTPPKRYRKRNNQKS